MVVWRAPREYDRYENMPCVQNSNSNEPCPQWAFDPSTNQLSTSGFAYDAAGHLTTDVTGAATRTYAWDAEGRLTQVTDNGGNTTTSYVYNALGQEVELKTVGSWQLEQVFDPQGERVGYYSAGGSQWLLAYVPWQGRELAKYASTTSFNLFHSNVLGSAGISTDQTGTVDDDMVFYPWGQVWLNSGSNTYDTHFAGIHAALQGSNLIDFSMDQASYRFYAPNPGRWHSPDPLAGDITNPQSLNLYAYALNNPTSLVDPHGLEYCKVVTDSDGNQSIDTTSCVSDTEYWTSSSQYADYVQVSQDVTVYVVASASSDTSDEYSVTILSVQLSPYYFLWAAQQPLPPSQNSFQATPAPKPPQPNPALVRELEYLSCVMNPAAFLDTGTPSDQSASSNYWAAQALWTRPQTPGTSEQPSNSPGSWEVPQALAGGASLVPGVPGCASMARGGQ